MVKTTPAKYNVTNQSNKLFTNFTRLNVFFIEYFISFLFNFSYFISSDF